MIAFGIQVSANDLRTASLRGHRRKNSLSALGAELQSLDRTDGCKPLEPQDRFGPLRGGSAAQLILLHLSHA